MIDRNARVVLACIVFLVVGVGIGFFFIGTSFLQTISPAFFGVDTPEYFSSQEECELKTGCECGFSMCDYVPEGKTYEEVCGTHPGEGWGCVRPKQQEGVSNISISPEDQVCQVDTDCALIDTSCDTAGCCEGEVVNKKYFQKYESQVRECRTVRGSLKMCDAICEPVRFGCFNNVCMTNPPASVLPIVGSIIFSN